MQELILFQSKRNNYSFRYVLVAFLCLGALVAFFVVGLDVLKQFCLALETNVPISSLYQFRARKLTTQLSGSNNLVQLRYRLMSPAKLSAEKAPVLIFLHGKGARGSDNVRQLLSLPLLLQEEPYRSKFPCYVLVPQCPNTHDWKSYNIFKPPNNFQHPIMAMLNDVLQNHPADPNRVYLCGFSMGGYGCWDLATQYPERFAALVPIAGGGDAARVYALSRTPIWNVHSRDDQTVPVTQSRDLINALKKAGGNPKYTEYANAGHGAWQPAFRDSDEILTWMFQQSRTQSPDVKDGRNEANFIW